MNRATAPGATGPPGWIILGPDAAVLAADEVACALLSVGAATLVGWPLAAFVHPADAEALRGVLDAARGGRVARATLRFAGGPAGAGLTSRGGVARVAIEVAPADAGAGVALLRLVPLQTPAADADDLAAVRAQRGALEAMRLLTDTAAIAHAFLQTARSVVAFDWAVVLRFAVTDTITGAEVVGVYPSAMAGVAPGAAWSPLDAPEAGVLASGTPALASDLQSSGDSGGGGISALTRLEHFGMRSRLHLPLFAGTRVAGCVVVYAEAPFALGSAEGVRLERILRPLGDTLDGRAPLPAVPAAPAPEAERAAAADAHIATPTAHLHAMGELVSGVAHELNNPLTSILGYAQIIGSLEGAERERAAATIEAEAQRAARIVRNLLSFARQGTPRSVPVDLEEVLQRVIDVRRYSLEVDNVRVVTRFSGIPRVMADEAQFEEVFLNLLRNAQQALQPRGGEIVVTTTRLDRHVRISVADNGPGIPPEMRARIFEPFFTTRDVGAGTGMGLSTVFGVVVEHGGRVWMEPSASGGADFIVELPLERGPLPLPPPPVRMPGVDGPALHAQIGERWPQLLRRMIFVTGDIEGSRTGQRLARGDVRYLEKPFDTAALLRTIREVLDAAT